MYKNAMFSYVCRYANTHTNVRMHVYTYVHVYALFCSGVATVASVLRIGSCPM